MAQSYLDIAPEVQHALAHSLPVVALESTIISHGMPYPQNVATAVRVEAQVRAHGAVPATIAIIDGRLKAGLERAQIEALGQQGQSVAKVSRRDLPFIIAAGQTGATTVAATMIIAHMANIRIFATGGIGGAHRGADSTFDISNDLQEFSISDVAVVTAGAKAILDLPITLCDDLLSAFGQDTMTTRYDSWTDVFDYCRRSANPVGRLVLRIAGYRDEALDRSADALCTALQLTNFWQDFAVDWRRGRLYVPEAEWTAAGARLDFS